MKAFYGLLASLAVCAIPLALAGPVTARGAFEPTFHPKPCSGETCQADDPRSNADCQGLLCSFSSSKAMQPPVTAAQAAEAERARAAAIQAAAAPPAADPKPAKTRKRVAKKVTPARTPAPTAAADAGAAAEPAAAH